MRQRLRSVVWRELPFSARRAIVGTLRTIDRWEDRCHRLWRSLIDSLDDSPAWLFVAIVGAIGVGLTILLFFTLTQEALAARSQSTVAHRIVESATLPVRNSNELDTRLCLVSPPVKPQPYPAEFDFTGVMLADVPPRRSTRPLPDPEPMDDFPPWEELPEFPRRDPPREPEPVAARPRASRWDDDLGQPDLAVAVDWMHQSLHRGLAQLEPSELTARSTSPDLDSRPRLAVLAAADRDGWAWFRERFNAVETPEAYAGEPASLRSRTEDVDALDPTGVSSRAEVALQIELHAPESARVQQPERSHIVVRNVGDDTIHRLEIREPTQPLELVTGAEPAAAMTDGVLSRELRGLRRGRERTLSLEWFPQSTARRSVGARILGEAVVAALVQVESEAAPVVEPSRPEPEPLPQRRREISPPDPEPQPAPKPAPEPEPRPVRRPRPVMRPAEPSPALTCTVRNPAQVAVRSTTALTIVVRNTGDADLDDVRLWVNLSPLLAHRHGSRLEHILGDLPAGQTREVVLRLVGAQPGPATARVMAFASDDVKSETLARWRVTGPAQPDRPQRPLNPGCWCVSAR